MVTFGLSSICHSFAQRSIWAKVLAPDRFLDMLARSVEDYDKSNDEVPGQHFIVMPQEAKRLVLPGVGRRIADPKAYHVREYRGRVELFLRPEYRMRQNDPDYDGVGVVIYTADAYKRAPDVRDSDALTLFDDSIGIRAETHIIVAVIAPLSPLPERTWNHNLAGGNADTTRLSMEDVRRTSATIERYWDEYCNVAEEET